MFSHHQRRSNRRAIQSIARACRKAADRAVCDSVEALEERKLLSAMFIGTALTAPPVVSNGTGLSAIYYDNNDGSIVARVDPQVNFDFVNGSPAPSIQNDFFGGVWQGKLVAQYDEKYVFDAQTDDGVRVWLDNQLIIDDFGAHVSRPAMSAPVQLHAGQICRIRMEWYEFAGDAGAKLLWSSPSTPEQVIPQSQLYPDALSTEAPHAATNLAATWRSSYVDLRWTHNSFNEMGYRIERAETANGPWVKVGEGKSFGSFSDSSAAAGKTYLYRISAYNAFGQSAYATVSVTTGTVVQPPAAPTELVATALDSSSIQLTWSDNSTNETGFKIERCAGLGADFVQIATVTGTTFTDTQLPARSSWAYRVRAYNAAGDSGYSNVAGATTRPSPRIGTGTGLLATYYNNLDLTDLAFTRIDPTVDFFYDPGQTPDPRVGPDNYSAVWEGYVEPQYLEPTRLHILTDDGARLYVNGQLMIDAWRDQGAAFYSTDELQLPNSGKYHIRLEWYQRLGAATMKLQYSSASQPMTVVPQTQLYLKPGTITPVIEGAPAECKEGDTITLSTLGVNTPGAVYNWLVSKNGASYKIGQGETFTFVPDDDGAYHVFLSAKLPDGESGTATADIKAVNVPPTLNVTGESSVNVGDLYPLQLSWSDVGADTVSTWTIDWGDGSKPETVYGGAKSAAHAYTTEGLYTIAVSATDEDGTYAFVRPDGKPLQVTVNGSSLPAVDIIGLPDKSVEGWQINAATNLSILASAVVFKCAWTVTKNGVPFASGTYGTLQFTPDDNGIYIISVTVTDPLGRTATDSQSLEVVNVAPTVTWISGPGSAARGQNVKFTGGFIDPGSADTHTILWDFGDGTSAVGNLTAWHIYKSAGQYKATLAVLDDDGGAGSMTTTVNVKAVDVQATPAGAMLVVGGSAKADKIVIWPAKNNGLKVMMNDALVGAYYAPMGRSFFRIVVRGQEGDDQIEVASTVTVAAELYGDAGNDRLKGGGGRDVLNGGEGDDILVGGYASDRFAGGAGVNTILSEEQDALARQLADRTRVLLV